MSIFDYKKMGLGLAVSMALLSGCGGSSSNSSNIGEGEVDQPVDNAPPAPPVAQDFTISLSQMGRFETGQFDESAAEILSFDPATDRLFVVNAQSGTVDVLDIANPATPILVNPGLDFAAFDAANAGFTRGDVNSVDVNAATGVVAVAIAEDGFDQNGRVAFFNTATLAFISSVEVGVLPDSVIFTNNGNAVIVANEGEPEPTILPGDAMTPPGFGPFTTANDPEGSISVIDVTAGAENPTVATVNFDVATLNTAFGNPADLENFLRMSGVVLVGNGENNFDPSVAPQVVSIAADLEPEFIAVSANDQTVWVTLQENNAVAIIDIADLSNPSLVSIRSFGAKDNSVPGNELDLSNEDGPNGDPGVNVRNWPIYTMYRPDTIASYAVNGTTYFVTANEGDAREFEEEAADLTNGGEEVDLEAGELVRGDDVTLDPAVFDPAAIASELGAFDGDLQDDANLGRIEVTTSLGDTDGDPEHEQLFAFGARSFSIWSATLPNATVDPASTGIFDPATAGANAVTGGLTQVFDSGAAFENITSERFGVDFNNNNDANEPDNRSDDAGPEPEALAVGAINGRYFAFIGLERVGGIMVYDVTDPTAPVFQEYINNRVFDTNLDPEVTDIGDLGPEGIEFISAENSPIDEPMIAVSSEVSGTITLYQININN